MNSSSVSIYDNVQILNSYKNDEELLSLITFNIIEVVSKCGPVCYCPFCLSSYTSKENLDSHLKLSHSSFLYEISKKKVKLVNCPFCIAKLFGHHLLSKHSLTYHGHVLIDNYFQNAINHISCPICNCDVTRDLILNHVEEQHMLLFEEWFSSNFLLQYSYVPGINNGSKPSIQPDLSDLHLQLENLRVAPTPVQNGNIKSILKSSGKRNPKCRSTKLPVRRVLSFDDEKENVPTPQEQQKVKSRNRNSVASASPILNVFQCGKCNKSFANNPQLVLHLKKEHRKLSNLLQPLYTCGICGARFYQNSYLKKHCSVHSLTKMR